MKTNLLELIACPACGGTLTLNKAIDQYDEIWEGELVCTECTAVFPIRKGMPYLYLDDHTWTSKATEAEGWVKIHKDQGIYEVSAENVDLQIPYFPEEPWISVSRSFDQALAQLHMSGNKTVLDLGAGRGWAAKEFAKLGHRVVALDVVADENVGLGRGKAIMKHNGVYFDRVIGDGEKLPFHQNTFDIVFCSATLHHASDLTAFFRNIYEVLKPGGRLCAMHEPCISVLEDEADLLAKHAQQELDLGINETRPNYLGYVAALEAGGFSEYLLRPAQGIDRDEENLVHWAHNSGVIRPSIYLSQPLQVTTRFLRYFGRQLLAIRKGNWLAARQQIQLQDGRQSTETAILVWAGGEMLLLATKQS